jgi:hypothetical protein
VSLRLVAEHEAAHAVVAAHFGSRLHRIVVRDTDGYTLHSGPTEPTWQAAITAAGDAYNRKLSSVPYVDLGCDDLARFERVHGLGRLWHAERLALDVLTTRRAAVTALADRLERERVITWA